MTDRSTVEEDPAFVPSPAMATMFLNFGYWSKGCASLDEACRALAELLGETAGIAEGDRVLDAGFGYADQDMHWMETRGPALIAGLNIATSQVRLAQKRVRDRELDDRIDLRVGSATDMPFDAASFDRVVALESAFHFDTREDFFREAARVLRPGGTLATADVVLLGGEREERIREMGDCHSLVPAANWYDEPVYTACLREAGFTGVRIRRITDHVYRPLLEFLRSHLRVTGAPDLTMESLVKGMRPFIANTDYVVVSAERAA